MPSPRTIELDGQSFRGAAAVVKYLQEHFGVGTRDGLQKAITRGASTYLGHSLIYQRETEPIASTSKPNTGKPRKIAPHIPGKSRLLGIRH